MEAEKEKDEGRWKNIVEAVICIGFLGGVLALRWTQAETVWYLVLGGAAAVVGIVSLALELVSRWKKRQSGTETGSYGKAAGIRKQGETGDVFSEYQNRKGLKQKYGTWNPQSDTEQQGWRRDSSVKKEKTWEKNEEQENRKMHSLMELEGHEEDLFGKTELLTSPEDIVRTVEVTLYFPDEADNLVAEERRLTVYEGETPAEAVVKALAERPMDNYSGLKPLLPKDFTALGANVDGNTCYLNLSANCAELMPESTVQQRMVLRGIVNSLCSLEEVEQVQILLNGDYQMLLGTQPISRPLLPSSAAETA